MIATNHSGKQLVFHLKPPQPCVYLNYHLGRLLIRYWCQTSKPTDATAEFTLESGIDVASSRIHHADSERKKARQGDAGRGRLLPFFQRFLIDAPNYTGRVSQLISRYRSR